VLRPRNTDGNSSRPPLLCVIHDLRQTGLEQHLHAARRIQTLHRRPESRAVHAAVGRSYPPEIVPECDPELPDRRVSAKVETASLHQSLVIFLAQSFGYEPDARETVSMIANVEIRSAGRAARRRCASRYSPATRDRALQHVARTAW